jgi:hypothetical protein
MKGAVEMDSGQWVSGRKREVGVGVGARAVDTSDWCSHTKDLARFWATEAPLPPIHPPSPSIPLNSPVLEKEMAGLALHIPFFLPAAPR